MGSFFIVITFFVMLAFIGINEGWRKSAFIFAIYLALVMGLSVTIKAFNLKYDISMVLRILLGGGFTIGLVLYNLTKGYIKRF